MNVQFDPTVDHYKVLGVKSNASANEIKRAYRRLAKQCHPDSTGGDKAKEARFKQVSQAYDVLGDEQKRAQYDAIRAAPNFGSGFRGGFPGFGGASGAGATYDLGDLFSQMFQGRGGRRNGPVEYHFDGTGMPADWPPGRGAQAQRTQQPPSERKVRLADGSTARQRGHDVYSDVRLPIDQAILGTVADVATLSGKAKVKIPSGTSSGVKLRLKGKGARRPNGSYGDHFVTVQIEVPRRIDEQAKRLLVQFMQRVKR